MKKETGLIHIYTGDGKGKTTAAVGLAARAAGGGLRVCYTSFHKRPELFGYTEMESLRKLGVSVFNFAKGHPHLDSRIDPEVVSSEAKEAVGWLTDHIRKEEFDLLVMDEIIISVRDNYLPEKDLLDFIQNKPETLELVITGRGATEAMIEAADYVSFVRNVKHPYDKGVKSRKGIEY